MFGELLEVTVRITLGSQVVLAVALALCPAVAHAQNTTFGSSVHLLVGQAPVRVTLATGSADRYYDAPVAQNRSYCAEATASDTELNAADPALIVYRADQTTSLGPDIGTQEPKGLTAARVCFIAPATETAFIKLSPASPAFENREYTLRFVETTLWANFYYTGGGFSSFSFLRNTTSSAVTFDIRWFDQGGVQKGQLLAQSLAANGVFFYDALTAVGANGVGSVQIAHSGSPEAIVGSQTTMSFAGGLAFDTLMFQRRAW